MSSNRRKFLKVFMAVTAGLGFIPRLKASSNESQGEKIKMLTPDGKIVEVDKSSLKKSSGVTPASNTEVREWMQTKSNNN